MPVTVSKLQVHAGLIFQNSERSKTEAGEILQVKLLERLKHFLRFSSYNVFQSFSKKLRFFSFVELETKIRTFSSFNVILSNFFAYSK